VGRLLGSEPVAIIMFFAVIISVSPFLFLISISFGDANLPHPIFLVTLYLVSNPDM
jgi:hypothetical protein